MADVAGVNNTADVAADENDSITDNVVAADDDVSTTGGYSY